jgi:hypothetical protein
MSYGCSRATFKGRQNGNRSQSAEVAAIRPYWIFHPFPGRYSAHLSAVANQRVGTDLVAANAARLS